MLTGSGHGRKVLSLSGPGVKNAPAPTWVIPFPTYAPGFNPVEYLWSYLKVNPMANLALMEATALVDAPRPASWSGQRRSSLLRSFVAHCPLPLRPQSGFILCREWNNGFAPKSSPISVESPESIARHTVRSCRAE